MNLQPQKNINFKTAIAQFIYDQTVCAGLTLVSNWTIPLWLDNIWLAQTEVQVVDIHRR